MSRPTVSVSLMTRRLRTQHLGQGAGVEHRVAPSLQLGLGRLADAFLRPGWQRAEAACELTRQEARFAFASPLLAPLLAPLLKALLKALLPPLLHKLPIPLFDTFLQHRVHLLMFVNVGQPDARTFLFDIALEDPKPKSPLQAGEGLTVQQFDQPLVHAQPSRLVAGVLELEQGRNQVTKLPLTGNSEPRSASATQGSGTKPSSRSRTISGWANSRL